MIHPIQFANWADGKIDSVEGCYVVPGPANNLLLKDMDGFTRAVRPIKNAQVRALSDEVQRLAALRDSGAISPEQFDYLLRRLVRN